MFHSGHFWLDLRFTFEEFWSEIRKLAVLCNLEDKMTKNPLLHRMDGVSRCDFHSGATLDPTRRINLRKFSFFFITETKLYFDDIIIQFKFIYPSLCTEAEW